MNSIELAKIYTPLLDKIYKNATLTGDLDTAKDLVKAGYNANEIVIPMIDMDGLADYSRNSGYVKGDVSLDWETVKAEFDRGRKFNVDDLDNIETGGIAFGKLAGEFIRTKVVPELDAYRFASYAQIDGISSVAQNITTGKDAIDAITLAMATMDDDEVPSEGRILYITPTLKRAIENLNTTESREVFDDISKVIKVPKGRFFTKITQKDGKSEGQTSGGFAKAEDGVNINFMLVHPSAVIQANKLVKPKILAPEVNPDSDGWIYGYRLVSIAKAYQNKVAGIYLNSAEAPATTKSK